MRFKSFIFFLFITGVSLAGKCQNPIEPGFEVLEFYKIADAYMSAPNLTFKYTIDYRDSVYVDSILEESGGSYHISDGKFAMTIDTVIEIIQGDQFNITVYHLDSMIIVNKKTEVDVLRIPALDSVFRASYVGPITVTTLNDTTRRLYFAFTNDEHSFKDYRLDYDSRTYMARGMRMLIRQVADPSQGMSVTGILTIDFSEYSTEPISPDYFDESRFIYKSGSTFSVHPDYTGYEILNNTAN